MKVKSNSCIIIAERCRSIFLHLLSVTLIFFLTLSSFAQLNPSGITRFSEKDGLTSESINDLIVDNKGFIWTGTPNGLSRYDGYSFKNFFSNPVDSTAIQGMLIYSIFQDSRNHIWMGTNPNYLEVYDPVRKTFKAYDYSTVIDPLNGNNPLYGYRLFTIQEDQAGRIYFTVGSFQDEPWLMYLDPGDDTIKKFKANDGIDLQGVYMLFMDNSGKIWLGTDKGMFYINDDDTLVSLEEINKGLDLEDGNYPVDFVFTADQHVWAFTRESNLIDYDLDEHTFKVWKSDIFIKNDGEPVLANKMIFDKKNTLWLGTDQGVYFFDSANETFGTLEDSPELDLKHTIVSKFAIDHFGDLWIGTYNRGLLRYEAKPGFNSFKSDDNEKGLTEGWASNIIEANNGDIWIHNNGGLNRMDVHSKEVTPFPSASLPTQGINIASVWKEENGIAFTFFDNSEYYYTFDDTGFKKVELTGLPEHLTILKYIVDSKGNEWLGTGSGLFRKEKSGKEYLHYDLAKVEDSLPVTIRINELFESQKHGIWLITDIGLYLYDYKNGLIERHGADKSKGDVFLTQDINSFYEDDEGIAWVGMWQGGLARYDVENNEIRTYTIADGLPSMSIQGVLGDDTNGTLWLSTFNGISRFDKATEKFNNFSIMDGIQGSQFSDGAYLKTSEGLMVFGGSNGVTLFDPNDIKTDYQAPEVFLTDLKLFNKSVLPGIGSVLDKPIENTDKIVLDHNQNDLSIKYTGLHYSNPIKNKYAYKLDNYEINWRQVGSQNEAFYPNLSPGHYVFRLRAANDKGVWSEDRAFLQITINPPWWRTWWAYGAYLIIVIFIVWRFQHFQRNRVIRREREKSQQRELEQSREIEKAYMELKATQSQLIQSEKMASLGELTAGIAHEIQNPLNFVNNFAEVSTELIDEINEELNNGDLSEVKTLSSDLKQNMEKITHHGRRADAIVKGMLQHSRRSTGKKEPTDINALCDEYLRLAYHGLRAKDKSFNAALKTDFDESIEKIDMAGQDIGRVILNLINNAFYAVSEKKKQQPDAYEPTVGLSTRKGGNKIFIEVSDNGNGIPQRVADKIFQPFFTTKPAGQGTGLGLSLSYEIVKAHGGELRVETEDKEGTTFIISIPVDE